MDKKNKIDEKKMEDNKKVEEQLEEEVPKRSGRIFGDPVVEFSD